MARITVDAGYADTYSDLYGGATGDVWLYVELAFTTNPGDTPSWTDVSAYAREVTIRRGRSNELDSFSAGTASVVLDNQDRRFDPSYTASPYYPNVIPMRRLRIYALYNGLVYDLFSGFVDSWPQEYANTHEGHTTVTATDAFKVLANTDLPSAWETEVRGDSPNHWWRLGEAEGAVAADAIGTTNATYVGGTLGASGLVPGDTDGSVTLDGSEDYVVIPASAGISTATWSLEFWFKSNGEATTVSRYLFYQDAPTGTISAYMFGASDFPSDPGEMEIGVLCGGVTATVTLGTRYDDSRAHHLVLVRSATAITVYIDGASVGSAALAAASQPAGTGYLGFREGSSPWYGDLDELVYYSSDLSAAQVSAHYTRWADDYTGARIDRVLDAINFPVADRDIDTGLSTIQALASGSSSSLDHLQAVELTENGRLFVDAGGQITFVDRHAVFTESAYRTSNATFGDSGSELRYSDITLPYDDHTIRNEVIISSQGQTTQVVSDATSQASYLKRSYSRSVLETSPDRMRDAANFILGRYKAPALRVDAITVKPQHPGDSSSLWPQVLGRELGERITVKRRPQGVGTAISTEVHLEGISHAIDAKTQTWVTQWSLSPAETRSYWRLGHSDDGKLGTTTRLSY